MSEFASLPAVWGLLGASVYALPLFAACLFENRATRSHSGLECVVRFVIAIVIGAIGAASIGPALASKYAITNPRDINAMCSLIGLTANKAAPVLIEAVPKFVNALISTFSKGGQQ